MLLAKRHAVRQIARHGPFRQRFALVVFTWVAAGLVYWLIEDRSQDGGGRNSKEFVYPKTWQNMLLSVFNTFLEYAGAKWHHPVTLRVGVTYLTPQGLESMESTFKT